MSRGFQPRFLLLAREGGSEGGLCGRQGDEGGVGWVLKDRIQEARPELGVAEKDAYIFPDVVVPLKVTHDVGDAALIL